VSEFVFDEVAHKYYLDGVELPSVTRILKPLYDFSAIAPAVLKHAADRGSAVHRAIELWIADDLDESSLCEEIKPYFAGFKKFVSEKRPEFVMSEQKLYHPDMMYAGTMDIMLKMPGLYLIDVKNTAAVSASWGIQLLAYQEAAIACPDIDYDKVEIGRAQRAVLWLKKTGTYQLVPFQKRDYANDLHLFTVLLNAVHAEATSQNAVAQWKKSKGE
jgi:hypothetical protein